MAPLKPDNLRYKKLPLNNDSGAMPALGFVTLIPDLFPSAIPDDAVREISERIKTQMRFNAVVQTGVPGFIPRGK